jgi:hypothetical protein
MPAELIESGKEKVSYYEPQHINFVWSKGKLSLLWKKPNIVPVYTQAYKIDYSYHRGLSLLQTT